MQLHSRDLQAVLDFLGDVVEVERDDAYTPSMLARLRLLIPFDVATYQEFDSDARCDRLLTGLEADEPFRYESSPDEPPDPDSQLYWSVGPCPIVEHRTRTHDLRALRMSDVVSRRRFRELPVYRDYFRHWGIEHLLDVGLPGEPPCGRSLVLFRAEDTVDFTERDRTVLESLRPHLYQREAHAALRRRLEEATAHRSSEDRRVYDGLTPREREIVELVAAGKTNAEIAAELWVAPSTVKKHLENVYGKVGVGRRGAAAALARAGPHH